jgi:hypothetical protein
MRLDGGGAGGDLEVVLVERLTRVWLKCVAHFGRVRAKVNVKRGGGMWANVWAVSELYERSLVGKEKVDV